MKRLKIATTCYITMCTIIATSVLTSGVAQARGADACRIPQMTTWRVPTDACITRLRNRPYENGYTDGEDVTCEHWRAVWNTRNHVHELAEGKRATPPTSFAVRYGCDDDGNDVVCVMALRQLRPITLNEGQQNERTIAAPQPFPTICVRTSKATDSTPSVVMDACIRGSLDWQIPGTPTRPVFLNNISPPPPPVYPGNPGGIQTSDAKTNCTTCHTKPIVMSTKHFVYSMIGRDLPGANPDAEGNWRNTSVGGRAAFNAMLKVNRIADAQALRWKNNAQNPNWKWAEVDDVPWFGKNTDHYIPAPRSHVATRCSGGPCHPSGFAINNHANWTQRGDDRDIMAMGGSVFQDKNYCEFVVAPSFADPDKRITFDNDRFRGGMRQLMIDTPARKWPNEQTCRDFWRAIGCEPDATKQTSLVKLCDKNEYPEMFQ